jgi:hypothetical protein
VENVLHSFASDEDGAYPEAPMELKITGKYAYSVPCAFMLVSRFSATTSEASFPKARQRLGLTPARRRENEMTYHFKKAATACVV